MLRWYLRFRCKEWDFCVFNALKEIILVFIYDVKDKGVYLDAP